MLVGHGYGAHLGEEIQCQDGGLLGFLNADVDMAGIDASSVEQIFKLVMAEILVAGDALVLQRNVAVESMQHFVVEVAGFDEVAAPMLLLTKRQVIDVFLVGDLARRVLPHQLHRVHLSESVAVAVAQQQLPVILEPLQVAVALLGAVETDQSLVLPLKPIYLLDGFHASI